MRPFRVRSSSYRIDSLVRRGKRELSLSWCMHQDRPYEDTVKRLLIAAQEAHSRHNQPDWHSELGLPASRTVREDISIFETTQSMVFCGRMHDGMGHVFWPFSQVE